MLLLFIIITLLILCFPITARSRSLAVAESRFVLQNITFRPFPSIALKIELTEAGLVLTRNNKSKKLAGKKKKGGKKKEKESAFRLELINPIRIREISVHGSFGCSDAALTALICGQIITSIGLIYNTLPNAEKFSVNFVPDYGKSSLQLYLVITFQFNVLIIIFILANILFRKIRPEP